MAYDKVVDSQVLDGYFSDIADSIRLKDGTQNTYTPAQMPQAIEDIPSGGGDEALTALVEGTATGDVVIENLEHLGLTKIAFSGYAQAQSNIDMTTLKFKSLIDSDMPSVLQQTSWGGLYGLTSIGTQPAASLKKIDLPEAENFVINDAGYTFKNLEEINAPKLIEAYLQINRSKLTELNLPLLTTLNGNMNFNSLLTTINLPECTSAATTFQECLALVNVSMPKLQSLRSYMFLKCTALQRVIFPNVVPSSNISNVFNTCTALEYAEFSKATMYSASIGANFFNGCSSLNSLVLRATNSMVALSNINAFTNTLIASGAGYVYVPSSLLATYQAATNWSTYSAQIRALEDYTVDGTVTGELDPNKI